MIQQISSLQHPIVKHLVKVRQDRDYRQLHNSAVIVGTKAVQEVCQQTRTKTLFVSSEQSNARDSFAEKVYIVTEEILKKVSGMQSPEGLIAEVELPTNADLNGKKRLIALDGISDPGNLGTLLRTALAFGWEGAFILDNGVDPFNDKALRAAKGATFRLPIAIGNWTDLQAIIQNNLMTPLVADIEGTAPETISSQAPLLVVLSNESHGASEKALASCKKISLPMPGEMESLNVAIAGGILMYLFRPSAHSAKPGKISNA